MSLGSGLITIVFFVAIFAVVGIISYYKKKSVGRVALWAIFFCGIYLLAGKFLFPIPLNKLGAEFEGCFPYESIRELFIYIPFYGASDFIKYVGLPSYLLSFIDFVSGAFCLGFALTGLIYQTCHRGRKLLLTAFLIPLNMFVVYFIIALITGYIWKYINITLLIVFVPFFFCGMGANCIYQLFNQKEIK